MDVKEHRWNKAGTAPMRRPALLLAKMYRLLPLHSNYQQFMRGRQIIYHKYLLLKAMCKAAGAFAPGSGKEA